MLGVVLLRRCCLVRWFFVCGYIGGLLLFCGFGLRVDCGVCRFNAALLGGAVWVIAYRFVWYVVVF